MIVQLTFLRKENILSHFKRRGKYFTVVDNVQARHRVVSSYRWSAEMVDISHKTQVNHSIV